MLLILSALGDYGRTAAWILIATLFLVFLPMLVIQIAPTEHRNAPRPTHKKAGLPHSKSNLRDQASPIHRPQLDQPARLQSLHIYPLKSCRGVELARSRVLPTGLEYDRLYTFAQLRESIEDKEDGPTWQFLTQRQLPLLANVKVDLWLPRPTKSGTQLGDTGPGFLAVRFPWRDGRRLHGMLQWASAKVRRGVHAKPEKGFLLPIDFPSEQDISERGYGFAPVKIWKETTIALNLEKDVPVELKQYLGVTRRLGLFRMDPSRQREVFRCAPRKEAAGYQPIVDFHDAYPLHLLSLSSLQDLESNIEKDNTIKDLDARRFRANMIVSGTEEYDEETWKSIRFGDESHVQGGALFDVSCRTVRCKMPNIDQSTGVRHRVEPDHSLQKYRDVDEGAPKHGCLGMQLCPMFTGAEDPNNRGSVLEVGMELSVLHRGTHFYIGQ